MPTSYRESVDTASAIKAILDSYPFGNGVLREILQNSDDAGASKQIFVLDHRKHPTQSLLDPSLAECQGPSLLCYNNSIFRESDWTALQTIHGSNKTADETKAGKYGLGFRSCYHITDNPHILSGSTLAVLDPHNAFTPPHDGGQKINFLEEGSVYEDQLAAFHPLATTTQHFSGTIIRLPLRTHEQSQRSRIKKKGFTAGDIQVLFTEFVNKELSVAMLFLKHITSIELREISPDGTMKDVAKVNIEDAESIVDKRTFARGAEARFETFRCTISTPSGPQTWRIVHSVLDSAETSDIMSKRLGYPVGARLADDKLYSHVALAFPLRSSVSQGKLFTLLPLPIHTDFPLHIHAILALTPDRQALRNREETGLGAESRERLLVEWNQAIFECFVPRAWAKLLDILVHDDCVPDIWSAWPQTNLPAHAYWFTLPAHLVHEVYNQGHLVIPTVSAGDAKEPLYLPLSSKSLMLASKSESLDTLRAATRVGLAIVQPETPIYNLLKTSQVLLFTPANTHTALQQRVRQVQDLSAEDKHHIRDFLLTPNDVTTLRFLHGLPLVPLVNGEYVSLSKRLPGQRGPSLPIYCMVLAPEEEIFGECDGELISLQRITKHKGLFTDRRAPSYINASRLSADNVRAYLKKKLGNPDSLGDEISPSDFTSSLAWIKKFWAWAGTQKEIPKSTFEPFHLLPTSVNRLRKGSSGILGGDALKTEARDVLSSVGVPILHDELSNNVAILRVYGFGRERDNIRFVLQHIKLDVPIGIEHKTPLQEYFLSISSRASVLTPKELTDTRSLPIYPTLVPDDKGGSSPVIAPVQGRAIFVLDKTCPLPVLSEKVTYIDISPSQPARSIATYIERSWSTNGLNEVQILRMAIPVLQEQTTDVMDALVARILSRWMDLSSCTRDLCNQSFVLVGSGERKPPSAVVDPKSKIAQLYKGETKWLPAGKFANQYLQVLRPSFIHSLTPDVIKERIESILSTGDIKKAEVLLRLIDESWDPSFKPALQTSSKWIPTKASTLLSASECRCVGKDEPLFDLVLPVASIIISSHGLRAALGWESPIPFSTSLLQLSRTLDLPVSHHSRIMILIKHLASELSRGSLQEPDFQRIRDAIGDRPWVPSARGDSLLACHAYFDSGVEVGEPFQLIHNDLLGGNDRELLIRLGCSERPSLDTLLQELGRLAEAEPRSSLDRALKLLGELPRHSILDLPAEVRDQILIPVTHDMRRTLKPLHQVYYNDQGRNVPYIPGRPYRVSTIVSHQLAENLGIPFASSLILDEDEAEDEDDVDMSEDFCNRIHGVLKDYDIAYAFNEFLANAIDAGATEFSMCLDERQNDAVSILTPRLAEFNKKPALVLYNNAEFTKEDFDGIRKVGQGGKSRRADTIGRFGLGALSLFHFTDLPMIISRGSVLFLDPSGELLPKRSGRRRTALMRPLSLMMSKYSDQIRPLESMFGFEGGETEFKGTLFRLPLRTLPSPLSNEVIGPTRAYELIRTQYYDLARSAMIFTKVAGISAEHRDAFRKEKAYIWAVVRGSEPEPITSGPFSHGTTLIKSRMGKREAEEETYFLASLLHKIDDVPSQHANVLSAQKLATSKLGIRVGLAFPMFEPLERRSSPSGRDSYLFSTLRLPVTTSLPAHISAQFALAPDRRSIRLDAADIAGRRIPESDFNSWILSDLVPRVYQYALQFVGSTSSSHAGNWTFWPNLSEDPFSRIVLEAFYNKLKDCELPICITPSGTYISPQNGRFCLGYTPSKDVRTLLKALKCNKFVRPDPALRSLCKDRGLTLVDASFVKASIDYRSEEFGSIMISAEKPVKYSESVLEYLLESKVSVAGLPLILQNGSPATIPPTAPLFISPYHVTHLFPSHRFLSQDYGDSVVKLFTDNPSLNIHNFTGEWLVTLIQEKLSGHSGDRVILSDAEVGWVWCLWQDIQAGTLPDARLIPSLQTLPLIPTFIPNEFVTIDFAREKGVLLPPDSDAGVTLAPLMDKLDILLLRDAHVYGSLLDQERFSLPVVVRKLERSNRLDLSTLSPEDHESFAHWVRGQLPRYDLDASTSSLLRRLPVWPAWINNGISLTAANDLAIFPHYVSLDSIQQYLLPHKAVALGSPALNSLSSHANLRLRQGAAGSGQDSPLTAITSENIFDFVRFPQVLLERDINNFQDFLRTILLIAPPQSSDIRVPNGNLHLHPVRTLYSQTVPLFSSSFFREDVSAQKFMHPSFRQFQPHLRDYGLLYEENVTTGRDCASAIHDDLVVHQLPEEQVLERAALFFQFYCNTLPSLAMSAVPVWRQFDALRFVPRDIEQPRDSTLNAQTYRKRLPMIVTVNDVTLWEHRAVCWTQRVVCPEVNLGDVVLLNRRYGVPTARDVVEHLSVLALRVSTDHMGNHDLASDLTETYQWLQDNVAEAGPLLRAHSTRALFLNVDDPRSTPWTWSSANSLVFNLQYDGNGLFVVHEYLSRFQELLRAAGAQTLTMPRYQRGPSAEQRSDDVLLIRFNQLREQGRLLDCQLEPTKSPQPYATKPLRAHKALLAAVIPHLEDVFSAGMGESRGTTLPFEGTYFGAKAVIEYVYTNDVTCIQPVTEDEMDGLLDEILDLLDTAEAWAIPDLKEMAGLLIERHNLLTVATVDAIHDRARTFRAERLANYCEEYKRNNAHLLPGLT